MMLASGIHFDEEAARKLEAIYATADVATQRWDTLRRLGLSPGERVIDIGCGPGFLTLPMAEAVGEEGRVLGIDVSEPAIALARRRCTQPWVELRLGDAQDLQVADDSFDVATCAQVLEYVPNADRAMAEIRRVLRPGGRGVIIATDWGTGIWHSDDLERMGRVLRVWEQHSIEPRQPRTLRRRLHEAGLAVTRIEIFTILNCELHADTYSHGVIDFIAAFVSSRGELDAGELQAWRDELHELGREDRYFFSLNRYVFEIAKH
jgi:arsenite methyltransferase